ncbi:CIC11C00000004211 [Sungouiella intermedia]|uniref:CIC11C00000004211 n=1 Tax=Sungouiella intermedia TaxID=45354 RepID=A0A1L0BCQ6_9ASCO|nr:CIC11C00000004211 [[Candida] intermedia]
MSPLKNLSSLKRSIARRIRQALEEIQENLANRQRAPVPVAVPVPMRGRGGYRLPISNTVFAGGVGAGARSSAFGGAFRGFSTLHGAYRGTRYYSTYTSRFSGFSNMRWSRINTSIIFHNFSSRGQFRLKLFTSFYKAPTLTELLKKKFQVHDESNPWNSARPMAYAASTAMEQVPLALRLNVLLTQKFHDMVMDLARSDSEVSQGCFVDFKVEPKLLIPQTSMMSGELLAELLDNLKRFERHIMDLQKDLARLSELGELPLRFLASSNTIRVYFPNCDREKLEALLLEKNVMSGIVHEDIRDECKDFSDEVSSVSEFDILSSCNMLTLSGSGSESSYDDVLSSSCESQAKQDRVEIYEEDSYCWA